MSFDGKDGKDELKYFADAERKASRLFENDCADQGKLFIELVDQSIALLTQLNEKIKDGDCPLHTIELFLGHNISLLSAAYNSLYTGYFGVSNAVLRQVAESLSLSLYFFEFPDDEKIYRKNHKSFYSKLKSEGYDNWIQGVLKKIDNKGKIIIQDDTKSFFEDRLYKGILEEASDFLHPNPDKIKMVVSGNSPYKNHSYYLVGPNYLGKREARTTMLKILHSALYNMMAIDKSFSKFITKKDVGLVKEAIKSVNKWNKELKGN